ncbi:hypothetical protein H257_05474 [Aphanomyces astaci]|uniref:Uncharacterized protein n=1 Tax=Aphanomyces astaci TaxID=112090 RepID=W4GQB8_APHAT|nr:hypothetical protein H257_05474 [Aphanomyces astaci]ETV81935.1 hypothetical protein H257_05474 [Aphanomyces astaci]|eukprot:XP_009828672.1 hypothetical protein H257_05474 [Aphanomyces astaci]
MMWVIAALLASFVGVSNGALPVFGFIWKAGLSERTTCENIPLECPGGANVYQLEKLDCAYPVCPPTIPPKPTPKPLMTSAPIRLVPAYAYTAEPQAPRRPSKKQRHAV